MGSGGSSSSPSRPPKLILRSSSRRRSQAATGVTGGIRDGDPQRAVPTSRGYMSAIVRDESIESN